MYVEVWYSRCYVTGKPCFFKPSLFVFGATTPRWPEPSHSRGFYITHNDASQAVGLLWMSGQLVAETSTWQHTQNSQHTNVHVPSGIRTHNLSRRAAADLRLRPRGHWDRLLTLVGLSNHRVTLGIIYISDGSRSRAHLILKRCLLKSHLVMRVFVLREGK